MRRYSDPLVTLLNGQVLSGGNEVETLDAFMRPNGKAIEATPEQARHFTASEQWCRMPRTTQQHCNVFIHLLRFTLFLTRFPVCPLWVFTLAG